MRGASEVSAPGKLALLDEHGISRFNPVFPCLSIRLQLDAGGQLVDGPQSAVQQQVRNGVAVRMAVLATIVRNVQMRNVEAGRRAG